MAFIPSHAFGREQNDDFKLPRPSRVSQLVLPTRSLEANWMNLIISQEKKGNIRGNEQDPVHKVQYNFNLVSPRKGQTKGGSMDFDKKHYNHEREHGDQSKSNLLLETA